MFHNMSSANPRLGFGPDSCVRMCPRPRPLRLLSGADSLPLQRAIMEASRDINRLIEIMARLRTPGGGCPWDLEQTFETIAPYTIEEAYEVTDAIERGD